MASLLQSLPVLTHAHTFRQSSWDRSGRNADSWKIKAGETRVLADIKGPGQITHIWMTQGGNYREVLIKIRWDNADQPSVLCPLGDFFCLGHGMVNSFQSMLFSASTSANLNVPYESRQTPPLGGGCALNCYVPMPFRTRALVELVNESAVEHNQYFYIDYETFDSQAPQDMAYFHAEFRRTNPFGGWAPHLIVNTPIVDVVNIERTAWNNNYVILETKGRGHYIGCNLSVTNFQGSWWGEGDDMIWVDGYKWPPDLHGTGSEDYLNQAWGMQPNAFMHNGSSIFEHFTGGYQTSFIFHIENPVRFNKEIKVTIEHGHGNHLGNEMSSVAYWYGDRPYAAIMPPPVKKRLPVLKEPADSKKKTIVQIPFSDTKKGIWISDPERQCPGKPVTLTEEMIEARKPVPVLHAKIKRLTKVPTISQVAVVLANESAIVLGRKSPAAEMKMAVAGPMLAVWARVFDTDINCRKPNFWEGSAIEIFASCSLKHPIGQVVLFPTSDIKRFPACAFVFGNVVRCTGVKQTFRVLKDGGYEMSALIPLKLLKLTARVRDFLLDMAVDVQADRSGTSRRIGLNGPAGNYQNASGYGRFKVG